MIALALGTALALVALSIVLYPLFSTINPTPRRAPEGAHEPTRADRAVAALREIEFDRETGKLSESDYHALRTAYTADALAAMRAQDASHVSVAEDEIEAAILQYRSRRLTCASCGPRREPEAIYCSTCGCYLAGTCGRCGATVTGTGARFCAACGHDLAA